MTFTLEQRRNAYKNLPEEIRELIMSNEATELISASLKNENLSQEQENLADSEIFNAMLGLQTLDMAINKIAELSKKNIESLSDLKIALQNQIFDKFADKKTRELKEGPVVITAETKEAALRDLDKRVEQQKAAVPETPHVNLPMVEKGEVARDVPHIEVGEVKSDKPQAPVPDYRYPSNKDPYREPLV